MAEDNDDNGAAEAARAQAEARRQRILAKADKRMGLVSGEQVAGDDDKKASVSNAARIRAARQRRYGKKAAPAEGGSATAPAQKEPAEATPTEENKPEPDTEETVEKAEGNDNAKTTVEEPSATSVPPVEAEGATEKKKYVGVARMRRNMIKKKKSEEAVTPKAEPGTSDSQIDPVEVQQSPPPQSNVLKVPIYMHIVTILLLFLAGADVGMQQPHHTVQVHNQLALSEHGLPLVHRSLFGNGDKADQRLGRMQGLEALNAAGISDDTLSDSHDEFLEEADDYVPNIDPLFKVDLDKLVEGPGILNQLAKGAVAGHRMILTLLYFWPMGILQALLGLPRTLLRAPPALCLFALVIRQLVGKTILGARIPSDNAGDGKDNSIDVLAMAKNFVTNFLTANFPTAAGLYDAFTHLRTDIYIMMFGVFCGLVSTHLSPSSPEEAKVGTDEL